MNTGLNAGTGQTGAPKVPVHLTAGKGACRMHDKRHVGGKADPFSPG